MTLTVLVTSASSTLVSKDLEIIGLTFLTFIQEVNYLHFIPSLQSQIILLIQ